ncbi:hypothetical protein Ddye_015638 [Dipteronia dyeriana]|uniref:Uncharacterized protein n=1 Tax=Dipteronia dyeriana TaxID=168575 RepID=A0AAD9WY30_9ROSI|nr:hypothetical protein Ddye_015638 [Dipteronia dyeriana]
MFGTLEILRVHYACSLDVSSAYVWSMEYLADLYVENQVISVGFVIRNHLGWMMASSVERIQASFSPLVAKVVAVLGIVCAVESVLVPFELETDALLCGQFS